jgi:RPAP1-like, N-terminal
MPSNQFYKYIISRNCGQHPDCNRTPIYTFKMKASERPSEVPVKSVLKDVIERPSLPDNVSFSSNKFEHSKSTGFPSVFRRSLASSGSTGSALSNESKPALLEVQEKNMKLSRQSKEVQMKNSLLSNFDLDPQIQAENDSKIAQMTNAEIEDAYKEISSMFSDETIALMKARRNGAEVLMEKVEKSPLEKVSEEVSSSGAEQGHPSISDEKGKYLLSSEDMKYLQNSKALETLYSSVLKSGLEPSRKAMASGQEDGEEEEEVDGGAENTIISFESEGEVTKSLMELIVGTHENANESSKEAFSALSKEAREISKRNEHLTHESASSIRFFNSGWPVVASSSTNNNEEDVLSSTFTFLQLISFMRSALPSQRSFSYLVVSRILALRRYAFIDYQSLPPSDKYPPPVHYSAKEVKEANELLKTLVLPPILPLLIRCAIDEEGLEGRQSGLKMLETGSKEASDGVHEDVIEEDIDGVFDKSKGTSGASTLLNGMLLLRNYLVPVESLDRRIEETSPVDLYSPSPPCIRVHPPAVSDLTSSFYATSSDFAHFMTEQRHVGSNDTNSAFLCLRGLADPLDVFCTEMSLVQRIAIVLESCLLNNDPTDDLVSEQVLPIIQLSIEVLSACAARSMTIASLIARSTRVKISEKQGDGTVLLLPWLFHRLVYLPGISSPDTQGKHVRALRMRISVANACVQLLVNIVRNGKSLAYELADGEDGFGGSASVSHLLGVRLTLESLVQLSLSDPSLLRQITTEHETSVSGQSYAIFLTRFQLAISVMDLVGTCMLFGHAAGLFVQLYPSLRGYVDAYARAKPSFASSVFLQLAVQSITKLSEVFAQIVSTQLGGGLGVAAMEEVHQWALAASNEDLGKSERETGEITELDPALQSLHDLVRSSLQCSSIVSHLKSVYWESTHCWNKNSTSQAASTSMSHSMARSMSLSASILHTISTYLSPPPVYIDERKGKKFMLPTESDLSSLFNSPNFSHHIGRVQRYTADWLPSQFSMAQSDGMDEKTDPSMANTVHSKESRYHIAVHLLETVLFPHFAVGNRGSSKSILMSCLENLTSDDRGIVEQSIDFLSSLTRLYVCCKQSAKVRYEGFEKQHPEISHTFVEIAKGIKEFVQLRLVPQAYLNDGTYQSISVSAKGQIPSLSHVIDSSLLPLQSNPEETYKFHGKCINLVLSLWSLEFFDCSSEISSPVFVLPYLLPGQEVEAICLLRSHLAANSKTFHLSSPSDVLMFLVESILSPADARLSTLRRSVELPRRPGSFPHTLSIALTGDLSKIRPMSHTDSHHTDSSVSNWRIQGVSFDLGASFCISPQFGKNRITQTSVEECLYVPSDHATDRLYHSVAPALHWLGLPGPLKAPIGLPLHPATLTALPSLILAQANDDLTLLRSSEQSELILPSAERISPSSSRILFLQLLVVQNSLASCMSKENPSHTIDPVVFVESLSCIWMLMHSSLSCEGENESALVISSLLHFLAKIHPDISFVQSMMSLPRIGEGLLRSFLHAVSLKYVEQVDFSHALSFVLGIFLIDAAVERKMQGNTKSLVRPLLTELVECGLPSLGVSLLFPASYRVRAAFSPEFLESEVVDLCVEIVSRARRTEESEHMSLPASVVSLGVTRVSLLSFAAEILAKKIRKSSEEGNALHLYEHEEDAVTMLRSSLSPPSPLTFEQQELVKRLSGLNVLQ